MTQPADSIPIALLDANILLRYLTGDPQPLADRARQLLERAERGEVRLVLTALTAAECVWVLKSFYKHPLPAIAAALRQVMMLDGVVTRQEAIVDAALTGMARHNVDFADAYLSELARREGMSVATFDGDFGRLGAALLTI
ncbi:PilT protein domain protein [Deinococcus aerius]|uniref:Ribonuclease VapC n=1 Tax=Deinococcus aerius TaxID=200253 RepID=A0A2I9CU64_9DEIO|nr:PIN domain-containing protein [Deinococcus aerius]GBF05369.1 PilT protein domain protein [Deinococcus aerius]